VIERHTSVVVLGGGPGGYEAALVAAQLGASVTVVERDGVGGAAVLTDCVPSKTLISTSDFMTRFEIAGGMGVNVEGGAPGSAASADLKAVNARVLGLASAQSHDIQARLEADGVRVCRGVGRVLAPGRVLVEDTSGDSEEIHADVVLVATGATPRTMATAMPDGERILTWQQIYDLQDLPRKLIVVGSGVTGAELAHAYLGLGSEVVLVSSRDRVLPGEDADAATVIEEVFRRRGMQVLNRSRAASAERVGDGVVVRLEDGREVTGSHVLLAVGSVPQTAGLGLEEAGVALGPAGHVQVDRVSRTSVPGIYAAGDCTGVLPLASVAAMQGRVAMWHALGDAVAPLNLRGVSANIFTDPEIATVGATQRDIDAAGTEARSVMLPLATNPRAKMQNMQDGFVKLFARNGSNIVVGGVVVAPRASELIFPVALAVQHRLTVDQVANTITVYPSMSGSIAEAARRLHSLD
jgi:NAD(P)H dehydrogenase (quinone)